MNMYCWLNQKTAYEVTRSLEFRRVLFQAEDGIRDYKVTGVQTCALPIFPGGKLALGLVESPNPREGLGRAQHQIAFAPRTAGQLRIGSTRCQLRLDL